MSTESSPRTRRSQRKQEPQESSGKQPSRRSRRASAAGAQVSRTSADLQDRWRRLRESTAVTTEPAREAATGWWGRRVQPVLDVVSPLGWLVVSITVISWIAGLVFGWAEALIAGLVGIFLLLLAVGFILGRSSYQVELDLARSRV
ncbi:MAG: hypothetical protein ACTH3G_03240, partial [Citricoccus sp.]